MVKYIINRFIVSIFTLLVLVTLVFLLIRLLPGDPFTSEKMTPEVRKNMMNYYGLDKPLHTVLCPGQPARDLGLR